MNAHPGSHERPLDEILAGFPGSRSVDPDEVAAAVAASRRRIAVFDDDPTGTQTVADVPVLTTWGVDDLRWALRQDSPAFYILTNTRSLTPEAAGSRNREVAEALVAASRAEGVGYVVASRGDSTLRGHYPLETDVVQRVLEEQAGVVVDGVVVAPAYVEGGRMTVDSVHWLRTATGMVPVGSSEFARDATFGYRSSDLREYVEEKTEGRWLAPDVARITLDDLRRGGVDAVEDILAALRDAMPVVVDAVDDDDLRVLSLALMRVEAAGRTFLYRVGPSFVRARAGLRARPPLTSEAIEDLRGGGGSGDAAGGAAGGRSAPGGLVIVGSHVGQTTRQLAQLRQLGDLIEVEVDVRRALDPETRSQVVRAAAEAVVAALQRSDVVVSTSREIVTGTDAEASLAIARAVSSVVVEVVRTVVGQDVPRWVVAKGGITSSDVATDGLGIRRAWVRGTLLPGIVSLWDPETTAVPGVEHVPYIVFAGNVGDDAALAAVVTTLRGGA